MTIKEKITRFFDQSDIKYEFTAASSDDELNMFETGFKGQNGSFKLRILMNEESEWFLILGSPQFTVPKKYMERGIQSVNRLNSSRLFTNLTLDPEDGEVQFRMGVQTGAETTEDLIARAIWTVCNAVDNDTPELMESIFRNDGTLN